MGTKMGTDSDIDFRSPFGVCIDGTYAGQPTMQRLNRLRYAYIYLTRTIRLKY